MTLSQKATWGKKAVEGLLATTVTFGVIERNAIRAVARAGVHVRRKVERPLINSICFANVLLARADMIIYTAVRRAMPTFLLVVKLLPTEITVMHSGISNVRWCRHLEDVGNIPQV